MKLLLALMLVPAVAGATCFIPYTTNSQQHSRAVADYYQCVNNEEFQRKQLEIQQQQLDMQRQQLQMQRKREQNQPWQPPTFPMPPRQWQQ